MGTDKATAAGVALLASGGKEGPTDTQKEEEELAVEKKEDGVRHESDCRGT